MTDLTCGSFNVLMAHLSLTRYFGPYPHWNEINEVLQTIEEKYDLRATSFAARYGAGDKAEYEQLFQAALDEVFDSRDSAKNSLPEMRSKFEEASLLFENKHNTCRDVVAVARCQDDDKKATVHVLQLREGLVAGRFSYDCELPSGVVADEECADVIQAVLERQHYPSGEASPSGRFSFFPDEILSQYPLASTAELKQIIRSVRSQVEPDRKGGITLRTPSSRGVRKQTDARAMEFAMENAQQAVLESQQGNTRGATRTSVDGTAEKELASILQLDKPPSRIECFDISHTQGEVAVGSRVVFIDGKPAKHLYRKFNINTVDGVNDYASLEEVLERRFRHAWVNGQGGTVEEDNPWSLPDLVLIDGGPGQLGAAVKGMAKASVFPRQNGTVHDADSTETRDADALVEEKVLSNGELHTGRSTFVAVCALAKNQEELFVYGANGPINDSPDSPALLLLRSLRDESHRFALKAHRKRRSVTKGLGR